MPIRLKLGLGQILEFADEVEHIEDLINAEIQQRGGIPEGEEAVHSWIEDRLAEIED